MKKFSEIQPSNQNVCPPLNIKGIGIDSLKVNVLVCSIDMNVLLQNEHVTLHSLANGMSPEKAKTAWESVCKGDLRKLENCREISIKDAMFDRFKIYIMMIGERYFLKATMKFTLNKLLGSNYGNLKKYQYDYHIIKVAQKLEKQYGIKILLNETILSEIELNANLIMQYPIDEYKYPIKLFLFLAGGRYGPLGSYECNAYDGMNDHIFTGGSRRNKSKMIRIYDKGLEEQASRKAKSKQKEMNDLFLEIVNMLRFEFKIMKGNALKQCFGKDSAVKYFEINQSDIEKAFYRLFTRHIKDKYSKWLEESYKLASKELDKITDKGTKYPMHWEEKWAGALNGKNMKARRPYVLDIAAMFDRYLKEHPDKNGNASKKRRRLERLKDYPQYEALFCGDYIQELFDKIEQAYKQSCEATEKHDFYLTEEDSMVVEQNETNYED